MKRKILSARKWVSDAKRLLEVKRSESWRASHRSFSAWLQDEAQRLNLQPSVLWRDIGGLEYYTSLGSTFDGLPIPDIDAVAGIVSPQHLELIEKLARTADRASIRALLQKALTGELTRSQLLEQWRIYKAKGELLPRRGRGVSRKDRDSRAASSNEPEPSGAQAVLDLIGAPPDWTGYPNPVLFRAFAPQMTSAPLQMGRIVDVVALVKTCAEEPIMVHGVEIKSALTIEGPGKVLFAASQLAEAEDGFDYCWLGVATSRLLSVGEVLRILDELPERFGVLQISGAVVTVLRAAHRNMGARSAQVLAELLSRLR